MASKLQDQNDLNEIAKCAMVARNFVILNLSVVKPPWQHDYDVVKVV